MSVSSDVAALTQGVDIDDKLATIAQADDEVEIPTNTDSLVTDLKTNLSNTMSDVQTLSEKIDSVLDNVGLWAVFLGS